MTQSELYYRALLTKFLDNRCDPEELEEVMDFLAADESNVLLLSVMQQDFFDSSNSCEDMSNESSGRVLSVLLQKIEPPVAVTINSNRKYLMIAAVVAAITVGIFFLTLYFWTGQAPVKNKSCAQRFKNDVQPGTNKATLTLGDGTKVDLDDAQNGTLAKQGNTAVVKAGNKLSYNSINATDEQVVFNTVSTPRGGQYQLQLPDGTMVWLNAATVLKFPTVFTGKERRVEIKGEAYFEVAQNRSAPFIVSVNNSEVQVLGTRFNVMAYNDEASVKTTLLDGAVKFKSGVDSSILKPGQQSELLQTGKIRINTGIDIDAVMAWKNGALSFNNADLKEVMRSLSRWYDVDVEYQNVSFNQTFIGELPKSLTLIEVLKALELTGNLRFGIEGKKIIVLPDPK
jgi:hypothetical protein